ncbi:sporulation protein YqfD [Alteribacillus sp. HJP-4]|uniref:sporulation protein YqfD n=1 Tax=Alteribacillus sp. HJP-4 TaxID=2775394 RepID=UPI0035CCD73C
MAAQFLRDKKIIVCGEQLERLINECMKEHIILKQVIRKKETEVHLTIDSRQEDKLHLLAEECSCEVINSHASPLQMWKTLIKTRTGFFTGILLFFLFLTALSQMVWNIEIKGAAPELEYNLREYMEEHGLKTGQAQFLLPPPEELQRLLLKKSEGVTWIGVEKIGTTYQIEVVEQTLPEEQNVPAARHLVARKTAVIDKIFAEKGKVLVKENELVHKGDVLISGFIGKGKFVEVVPATGSVLGETWYTVEADLPLTQELVTATGNSETRYELEVFGYSIPIWGFQAGESYSTFQEETDRKEWYVLSYLLPFQLEKTRFMETSLLALQENEKSVLKKAKKAADLKMKQHLSAEASITAEKILHEQNQDGKVKMTVHYLVTEDIISESPIIQGE